MNDNRGKCLAQFYLELYRHKAGRAQQSENPTLSKTIPELLQFNFSQNICTFCHESHLCFNIVILI